MSIDVNVASNIEGTVKPEVSRSQREKLLAYYEKAGPDYKAWSPNYNMHFGYYGAGANALDREALLQDMNAKVLDMLTIKNQPGSLVDMGCGLGATLRFAAQKHKQLDLYGVTVVPWQVERGNTLNQAEGLQDRIEIVQENYCDTSILSGTVDYVVAIESSCYAQGASKSDLLQEIHRILKPGGKFVIADGFLIGDQPMNALVAWAYKQLCTSWALTELARIESLTQCLQQTGFEDITTEDISWNVAPSVAHVPFVVVKFLIKQIFFSKTKMTRERWDNLKSPLLTMLVGLARKHFRYFLVSGTKQQQQ